VEILVSVPCVIYEDDHLLVVNKPPGLNTHAPSPYAGEGIYDWLRHREPRWARLAIIHRLDKETSGVLVFSKTDVANRSLTEQFTRHIARKKYLLLTDRPMRRKELSVRTALIRLGDKHVARPAHTGGELAETRFRALGCTPGGTLVEAEPVTGRTHQIRVHAKANGFPILGDTLYGGTPAARVHLHAQDLSLKHPATGKEMKFTAPVDFSLDSRMEAAFGRGRVVPDKRVPARSRCGGRVAGLACGPSRRFSSVPVRTAAERRQLEALGHWLSVLSLRGAYHKTLTRQIRKTNARHASPQKVLGETAPDPFVVSENGIHFGLSFNEGYSVGLFLDQRDNRRRFLTGHVASGFPLRWDAAPNPPPTAPQEGSKHSDTRERSSSMQVASQACSPAQLPFPHSRRAIAPLRRDGGWEGPGVGSFAPLAGMQLLNAFAYTCGFSVCAAKAGARTTSPRPVQKIS
jgi:RluA family pseudouridine synthase